MSSLVITLLLVGCSKEEELNSPPTPPNSFALTQDQFEEKVSAAEKGDVQAMTRLADYYLYTQHGDLKGWYWLEKAAEAGNAEARQSILVYYSSQTSDEMKARGVMLGRKWGM